MRRRYYAVAQLVERQQHLPTEDDVVDYVLAWKRDMTPYLERAEVLAPVRSIAMLGWLTVIAGEKAEAEIDDLALAVSSYVGH